MDRVYAGPYGGIQPLNAEEIYDSILHRILNLELEPGQKISENQIAQQYQVSRSIIHSIFVRLHEMGFVEVYPQRGTYVTKIDADYIEDLLVLRTALEKEAVYEVLDRLSQSQKQQLIDRLEENLEKQEAFRGIKEFVDEFDVLDTAFHWEIIKSIGRQRLIRILDAPMLHIARWRTLRVPFSHGITVSSLSHLSNLIDQHRAILEGIRADDCMLTQQTIAHHLDQISKVRGPITEAYPQYFV